MTGITHIGLTVPDIDAAVEWYTGVLDFELLAGPFTAKAEETDDASTNMTMDLLGEEVREMRNAHLTTANQVGLELFEFVDPRPGPQESPPWQQRFFHLCLLVADIRETAARIEAEGGKQRSRIWTPREGKPYRLVYMEDPFGNIIELYSHSTEVTYGNMDSK
ncbi:VOC family protein [uncultured Marinococcus sp.]|jgi:catechol 2,3-dioxygenase-like lactoylglutathione lyase family enzyme|uniref:VOC family protein n=1 Tax=uncultured Marinococcus sp. TaxID=487012 RepID=UPI002613E229|nr:VOC family protein [uncultured Marinococcus sp.]